VADAADLAAEASSMVWRRCARVSSLIGPVAQLSAVIVLLPIAAHSARRRALGDTPSGSQLAVTLTMQLLAHECDQLIDCLILTAKG
jgi:hypothetical protein